EVTVQDWEAVRGVVLDGAIYCTRAVIESMVKNKYGRIVFFTGEGAFMGGSGRAAVSAAKMGLVGLARGLASEFAAQNIRVNVVSPGSIDTSRANPEWYQGRTPNAGGIPLGRQGTVDEIAATCLFLVSDDRAPLPVLGQRRGRLHHGPDYSRQRRRRVLLGRARCRPSRGWGPAGRAAPPVRRSSMKRSTDRILTTHVGSLSRPDDLVALL